MIYIIEDDPAMAYCLQLACGSSPTKHFTNAFDAITDIMLGNLPSLVFLDILLDGPDGFTLLNEFASYIDTAQIPIVVVTSLGLSAEEVAAYNVQGVLDKCTMTPEDIQSYVSRFTH